MGQRCASPMLHTVLPSEIKLTRALLFESDSVMQGTTKMRSISQILLHKNVFYRHFELGGSRQLNKHSNFSKRKAGGETHKSSRYFDIPSVLWYTKIHFCWRTFSPPAPLTYTPHTDVNITHTHIQPTYTQFSWKKWGSFLFGNPYRTEADIINKHATQPL